MVDPNDRADIGQVRLNVQSVQDLWRDFVVLVDGLEAIKGDPAHMDHQKFKAEATLWANRFRLATFDEDVTPYIHCEFHFIEN